MRHSGLPKNLFENRLDVEANRERLARQNITGGIANKKAQSNASEQLIRAIAIETEKAVQVGRVLNGNAECVARKFSGAGTKGVVLKTVFASAAEVTGRFALETMSSSPSVPK